VLNFDGDTDDRGNGELHHTDAAGFFMVGDGSLLHDVGVNTNETDGVTARNVRDRLNLTSHHEDGTLDVLDVEVNFGSALVVGTHDADFLASGDGSRENATEGEEATTVGGGHHLGDEDHERTVLVTLLDGLTARIIDGAFV